METFTEAVERFLKAATWLKDEDAPAVALLEITAAELDDTYTAAKATVLGQTHRQLMKRSNGTADFDEDEDFLNSL